LPQDKTLQKQIEKETEKKEEKTKKVEETEKENEEEEEEKESKKKGTGFYEEEMNKKTKGKPDYESSSNGGFFGGETEKFNFEENENDNFFGNIENIGAERPNFYKNSEPETEEKNKQRGVYYGGAKREKESFNFQETEDVEQFFGNVEKVERENEDKKSSGKYGISDAS
jgi:hypothetical protein